MGLAEWESYAKDAAESQIDFCMNLLCLIHLDDGCRHGRTITILFGGASNLMANTKAGRAYFEKCFSQTIRSDFNGKCFAFDLH
jgi:hypothetical protein